MGLQFVIGTSGAGKSTYVQTKVVELAKQNPDKQYFVIVPDQFTMQTQKDLVLRHTKGILNIDVLSFGRLSHRLFAENGDNKAPVLDDTGKSLILRKVAGDCEEQLPMLGSHLRKIGFIHEIKSAISEFYQYGIDGQKMKEMIAYAKEQKVLQNKLKELSILYASFQDYIKDRFITKEEILDQAARLVKNSTLLKHAVVVLDGFTGFTPVQTRFLLELFGVIDDCMVTVTIDPDASFEKSYPQQYLFAMSLKMIHSLEDTAKRADFAREQDIRLSKMNVKRFEESDSLAFLERNLFRYSNKQYPFKQEDIRLLEADTIQNEIHAVCAEVARLVQEEGYAYRDIALITGALSDYEYLIEEECRRMCIPIYMDHTSKLSANAAMDFVLAALQVVRNDFAYEDLFHFLRNPFSALTDEETDLLENYCLEKGIRGRKKYERIFVAKPSGVKAFEERLQLLNSYRERIVGMLTMLERKKKTVREFATGVYEFMVATNLQKKCTELAQEFTEKNDLARAKEYGQVYRVLVELLDQFVGLLGEESMEFSEFIEILKAGIDECKIGTLPQNVDRMVVGDMERTRLTDISVLFFVGINDGIIPKAGGNGGIINDIDREFLVNGEFDMAPGPRQKMYIQRFYLYLNMTKPKKKLYLTYSRMNGEGASIRPSYLIETMKKMYPELSLKKVDRENYEEAYQTIRCRNDALFVLADSLREYAAGRMEPTPQEKHNERKRKFFSLYDVMKEQDSRELTDCLTKASFIRYEGLPLKKEVVNALYSTMLYGSVSRFEQFANCAYRYFLQYGLKLSEREGYEIETKDWGQVYHSCLENFSHQLVKENTNWFEFSKELGESLIEKAVDETAASFRDTILYSSARQEYAITKMKRIMRRTVDTLQYQLRQGSFVPTGFELSFGEMKQGMIRMELPNGEKVKLDGRIDRVDLCEKEDKIYVKIVDYKSGKKDFQLAELYYGKQLQLVVYMNAVLEEVKKYYPNKQVVPAAMLYYSMKDPFVERKADETEESIRDDIRKELRQKGVVLADDDVVMALDAGMGSKSKVIPVERTAKGGFSARSSVYPLEDIEEMEKFVNHKIREIATAILNGVIRRNPTQTGESTSCEYCTYRINCGFDKRIPGEEIKELESLSDEEAMKKIREENNR